MPSRGPTDDEMSTWTLTTSEIRHMSEQGKHDTTDVVAYMNRLGHAARAASVVMRRVDSGIKNRALQTMARLIDERRETLAEALYSI